MRVLTVRNRKRLNVLREREAAEKAARGEGPVLEEAERHTEL